MGFGLKQTVAPSAEPLGVDLARDWLRVQHDKENAIITSLIAAARRKVEDLTGRQLITATWELTLDGFPGEGRNGGCGIEDGWYVFLPMPRLIAVSSIVYVDTAGVSQTLAASKYRVDGVGREPARIEPAYGEVWPTTRGVTNAVTITYTAGYGIAADVPDGLKTAMRLLIAHWYLNRAEVVTGTIVARLPEAFEALCAPFWHGHLF